MATNLQTPDSGRSVGAWMPLFLLLSLTPPGALGAGTPQSACGDLLEEGQTSDHAAVEFYEAGLASKEAAWELERAAQTAASQAEREELLAAAKGHYLDAVNAHGKALKLHLTYYQAANELGYALRKTGDYRKALGAYNFALQIKPDFYPAIEYRGEAYLALGQLDRAKDAYLILFQNDPELAAELLAAMAAAETGDATFSTWVAERETLAALTPGGSEAAERDW